MNRYKQVSTWMEKSEEGEWCKYEDIDQVIEHLNQNFIDLDQGWQRTYDHDVGKLKEVIRTMRDRLGVSVDYVDQIPTGIGEDEIDRLNAEIARLREENEMVMDANEEFIAQINQLRKQLGQEVLTLD